MEFHFAATIILSATETTFASNACATRYATRYATRCAAAASAMKDSPTCPLAY